MSKKIDDIILEFHDSIVVYSDYTIQGEYNTYFDKHFDKVMSAILSVFKEMVEKAEPGERGALNSTEWISAVEEYKANLLKAIEEESCR